MWGGVALWDLVHRAGHVAEARQGLAAHRVLLVGEGFDRGVALTHLVEGDWYATSGGSPETLGFHLTWSELPPSAHSVDLDSAGHWYERAEAVASASGILAEGSRFAAALQLRWAYLAWCRGDYATQRARLEAAGGFMAAAGDGAGERLAEVHLVLVDLAEGRLADHVATMGTGWSEPATGPLAETRVWAEQDGSASWCAGLGRLMERVGERWSADGDVDRAALALTGAAHLIGAVPMIERRPLIQQLAEFDSARNLHARALIRTERVPAEPPLPDTVGAWDGLTLQLDQRGVRLNSLTLVTAALPNRTLRNSRRIASRLRSRAGSIADGRAGRPCGPDPPRHALVGRDRRSADSPLRTDSEALTRHRTTIGARSRSTRKRCSLPKCRAGWCSWTSGSRWPVPMPRSTWAPRASPTSGSTPRSRRRSARARRATRSPRCWS